MSARFRPTPGVYAANTSAAMDRLAKGQPGDTIIEAEMETVIGEPCIVASPGYGVVTRAINYVRRDAGIDWQRDRTIPGWRCRTASERISYVKRSGAKRVGRLAKRNLQILAVDSNGLSTEQKRDQQILQVTHGMIFGATRSTFRRQITGRIAEWQKLKQPTDPQLIELMRGAEEKKSDTT